MMKKNLIKFFITVSILLTTFNTNTLAEKAIGGEKLQKLLTENHIIINYFTCPLRNNVELNFDAGSKTYERDGFFQCQDGDGPHKSFIHPTSGTWELVDAEKDVVQLDDTPRKYDKVTRIQLLFGDNGNIYNLNNQSYYPYRLENKKQRIENNARRIEAEELKLKKIEEEKKQLAIKREQEKIKQDEEKRRLEEEKEIIRKKEAEEEAKSKREKFLKDTFFFIIVSASIVGIYYYINRFHKEKIVFYKDQNVAKLKNIWNYISCIDLMKILNKIINKEATVQEKLTYLLPAVISVLYLIDIIFVLLLGKGLFRKLIPEFLNITKIIFIFSSIYAAYKNYDYFKKVTATSLLLIIICFFWIYASLYPSTVRSSWGIFVSAITLIQIYLFLNLHLDKKFNLNLFKNKFVIGALILFGAFIFYNIFSENSDNYSKNNNPEENLRVKAARAVDAASDCYRSLPSHAQSGSTIRSMLDARKWYSDGVKFLNMDQTYRSMAPSYFNNAISYSNVVMQIGKAYGSRSCG